MITTNILVPGAIIEFYVEVNCDPDEVLALIRRHYGTISTGVIWNFAPGSNRLLNSSDLGRIAETARAYANHRKTAYVTPGDLEYDIMRMYETYAQEESVVPMMKVFRDRAAALDWVFGV